MAHLVVVTLVFVGVALVIATNDSPEVSLAPVQAFVATLPASSVVILLPEFTAPWGGIVAGLGLVAPALVQAWLLFRGHRKDRAVLPSARWTQTARAALTWETDGLVWVEPSG